MDIADLVKLTSKAWSLAILSRMHEGIPGRQAALLAASGANRTAFGHSLKHLIEIGMLERNPGHGHPLRPEFRLTPRGREAARLAHLVFCAIGDEHGDLLRRIWTLPILTTLREPRHFSDIKRGLPAITDRALSQALRSMEERGWVSRSVSGEARPPRSLYCVTGVGVGISRATQPIVDL